MPVQFISHLTFQFLYHSYESTLRVFCLMFIFSSLSVSHAQAYGFQNGQNPLFQQAPPPKIEPGNQLFLPIIAGGAAPLDHDERPSQPPMHVASAADHTGDSDTPPPEGNRHTFVTDSDGYLDGYWFRNDLPDGQLKFTIEITSPVVGRAHVDSQGFLTQEAIGNLVRRSVMPFEAILTLHVFDVDHDAEMVCPERDYVRINGKQITLPNETAPVFLRSGHEHWNEWKVHFPVTYLKFPVADPFGGAPTLGSNEIAIEVNAGCQTNGWAVKIDWGSIALRPNLTYPIVFVPGWTGNETTFERFEAQAITDGYQAFNIEENELDRGIATLEETTPLLLGLIRRVLSTSAAEKVYVFAHSRGGIFIRHALRTQADLASSVAGYITFGTPHHGTDASEPIGYEKCLEFLGGGYWRCVEAARSLNNVPMKDFNYGMACHEITRKLTKLFFAPANYTAQLDNGTIPQDLRDQFAQYDSGIHILTADAQVHSAREGYEWVIVSGIR